MKVAYEKADLVLKVVGFKKKSAFEDRENLKQIFLDYPDATIEDVIYNRYNPEESNKEEGESLLVWFFFIVSIVYYIWLMFNV